jgi:Family of unknown function (DUF6062)
MVAARAIAPMTPTSPRDAAAFEVREALAQPGCAVCRLVLASVGKFFRAVAYEQVNDPAVRADLRAARGFCNPHAYRWLRDGGSVLGTAIVYRDVLRSALAELSAEGAAEPGGRGLLGTLLGRPAEPRRRRGCPACRAQREAERRYVGALLALLGDPAEAERFERSAGLCLPHTLAALRRGGPAARLVEGHTRRTAKQLVGELDEVIRKEDYRFRDEARTAGERTAPARAIAWATGAEGLAEP